MNHHSKPSRGSGKQPTPRRGLGIRIQFREGGHIHADLFDKTAQAVAQKVADCEDKHNKGTQLRRFYDELVMWESRARSMNEQDFQGILPFVRMLKAKAAYAEGRGLVDGAFVGMLEQTIDAVRNVDDLRLAKLFFESFMGFYKLEKGDK